MENLELDAQIDALLSGSDMPAAVEDYSEDGDYNAAFDPDFEVMAPPHSLPVEEAGVIELAAEPVPVEAGEIELDDDELLAGEAEAPSPAPKKAERVDRVTAFKDCVAEERARQLIGSSVLDPIIDQMGAAPKKVADKVYNVLCHLGDRSRLSNFTEIAVKALMEKDELTPGGLATLFVDAGYTAATAKSQASQQMKAMSILGIASYQSSNLKLTADSAVLGILLEKHKKLADVTPSPSPESTEVSDEDLLLAVEQSTEDAGEEESDDDSLLDI